MAVRAGTTVVVASGDAGPFNTIRLPRFRPARDLRRGVDRLPVLRADQLRGRGPVRAQGLGERQHQLVVVRRLHPGRQDTRPGRARGLVVRRVHAAGCALLVLRQLPRPAVARGGKPAGRASPRRSSPARPRWSSRPYAKAQHGSRPSPAAVKQILLSTATDLGAPATEQGTGLLNSLKAVELASWRPGHAPAVPTLKLSSNQLNYAGKPGATASCRSP